MRVASAEFRELLSSGKALKSSWGSIFRKLNCVFSPKQGELSSGLGIFAAFVNCFGPKIQNRGSFYLGSMLGIVIPGMWSGWMRAGGVRGLSLLSPRTDLLPPDSVLYPGYPHLQGGCCQSLLTDVDSQLREVK